MKRYSLPSESTKMKQFDNGYHKTLNFSAINPKPTVAPCQTILHSTEVNSFKWTSFQMWNRKIMEYDLGVWEADWTFESSFIDARFGKLGFIIFYN